MQHCFNLIHLNLSPNTVSGSVTKKNAGFSTGLTCLHVASLNRHLQLVKLLMKKGADLNIQVSVLSYTPHTKLHTLL